MYRFGSFGIRSLVALNDVQKRWSYGRVLQSLKYDGAVDCCTSLSMALATQSIFFDVTVRMKFLFSSTNKKNLTYPCHPTGSVGSALVTRQESHPSRPFLL